MSSFIERELKFEVGEDFRVPDLQPKVAPGGSTRFAVQQLRSEYFDTADQAVRRAGATLRRRTGTDDVGWHLKLPAGTFREELHFDLSEEPPGELIGLLLGVTRSAPLEIVATLQTERHVTRIIDAAGNPLVDVDLDHVRATAHVEGRTVDSTWTELEVELASPEAPDELLAVVERRLIRAGAQPAGSSSKVGRALAGGTDEAVQGKGERGRSTDKKKKGKQQASTAIATLLPYLAEQQRTLLLGDVALRRGDASVIHRTRVATRRLRSVVRVFARLFEPEAARRLDEELRWYAELLGAVRDSDVLLLRLRAALQRLEPELVLGPVRDRIEGHLHATRTAGWQRLQDELSAPRYLKLLREIAAWTAAPPATEVAARPETELVRMTHRAEHRVGHQLSEANRTGDVELLHRARKAAKRARYAAEASGPVAGKKAVVEVDRYRKLQDLLGEHQDSTVAAQLLRQLGAAAGITPGENGFTFGLLFQQEQQRAAAARREAQRVARRYR